MRLRLLGVVLLLLSIAIAAAPPSARAQVPSDAELDALNKRTIALYRAGKYADAIPLAKQYAASMKARHGENSSPYATAINNLAALLVATNRLSEAEPLMRRALAIDEKALGPDHPKVATSINNLAQLLQDTNRLAEAEPLIRRALANNEKALGPNHPKVATSLNNLAGFLYATNRLVEAEPLFRRALAIDEKAYGPDHPKIAIRLNNLTQLLRTTNRLAEVEPLMRRALAIDEKVYGPDHPNVAIRLNNLAQLLQDTNRLTEAEPLMRNALAIDKKALGPDHPKVARNLNNLAQLLADTNRLAEAEPLFRRALAIGEKSLGADHPKIAIRLNNLATLREEQNDWAGAATLCMRAKPIMIGANAPGKTRNNTLNKALLTQNTGNLRSCARALYRANAAANREEGFALAQWALQNAAADALTSMSTRFAKGDTKLARLVREVQDLLSARAAAYRQLDAAAGKADTKTAAAIRAAIKKIEGGLAAKLATLRQDFPNYAKLSHPQPLTIGQAQALLGENQALVQFLDLWQYGRVPGETLVFVLTKTDARWLSIPLGRRALRSRVTALRCGLDSSNWRQGEKSREVCKTLLNTKVAANEQPPFDAGLAYKLYRDLFGGVEDLIKDKSLLIVPSGPLTQLPFEVLVTAKPDKALPRFKAYKQAAWLGQRQAITVLPSAGSLSALHTAKSSEATAPFIGFGNPLLTGRDGNDRRAWAKQNCSKPAAPERSSVASSINSIASLFRGGVVNVELLRKQASLPETADELCTAASDLGVPKADLDKTVYLGERATVSQVKALSARGALARARVVHFATHGLLAGETAMFTKHHAEPALLLTPPDKASEADNGLLTASEVAELKLDADWVIMSACNTAGAADGSAEALSGLARAFFYAGARSLLVSHWPVNSGAAVKLTTGAINEMKASPTIGRAEALRRSIAALIAKGNGWDHPSIWAPFVLVGNGGQ